MRSKISIIVPIKNERSSVGRLLASLEGLKRPCVAGTPASHESLEVIFVDGGSTDGTPDLIGPAYTVIKSQSGRARQMNAGAAVATGDILWFVHCDSTLDPHSLYALASAVANGHEAGCFTLRFTTAKPLLNVVMAPTAWLSNRRVRKRNLAFGDQGIFLTRRLFDEVGGFPGLPLMEDLELSLVLRERGVRFFQVRERIVTSARRYEKNGAFATILMMWRLQARYRKARACGRAHEEAVAIATEYERGR